MIALLLIVVVLKLAFLSSYLLLEPWTRKFLRRTVQHKWFVLVAGLRTGAPLWRLVVHDLSKFLPSEAPHYGRQYYGPKDRKEAFQHAWHLHQRRNPHHWEYWVRVDSHLPPFPMPAWAVQEMVADWMAATRTISGRWPEIGDWPWYEQNFRRIDLNHATWRMVERTMGRAVPLSKSLLREQTERAR